MPKKKTKDSAATSNGKAPAQGAPKAPVPATPTRAPGPLTLYGSREGTLWCNTAVGISSALTPPALTRIEAEAIALYAQTVADAHVRALRDRRVKGDGDR